MVRKSLSLKYVGRCRIFQNLCPCSQVHKAVSVAINERPRTNQSLAMIITCHEVISDRIMNG